MTRVAILGGGVAGLTAAHELAERGFDVVVLEARDLPGGKARSLPVPGSGTDGRHDLPAEHGFRFFPGFYRHLPDTMRRIPHGAGTVLDHLTGASQILLAQAGGRNELVAGAHLPESLQDLAVLSRFLFEWMTSLGIPPHEHALLMERLLALLTSCDERRYEQWERQSWWTFIDADRRSPPFRKFLADGLTRTLVAARAREISARTGGLILAQLIFDLTRAGGRADRVLDAPTNDAWIDPWVAYLRGLGVELRLESPVLGLTVERGRIAGATVPDGRVTADFYVAALPVEVMRQLAGAQLRALEPRLAGLDRLVTRWMNGFLFYLDRDVRLVHGHAIYIDSEWALTSISQAQFWDEVDLAEYGDGRVRGILSIDVSDWETPGRRTGKVASKCTREEIRGEVWGQLVDHLDRGELDEDWIVHWFLDPAIQFPNPSEVTNLEPLLINTAGSWADRPDAATGIPNLLLAADYVRTHTDLATMEGANEAARRAVNAILDTTRSGAARCDVFPLREPAVLAPARALDRLRWRLFRRPARAPLRVAAGGELEPRGPLARAELALGRVRRPPGR
jgi:uncharacterized protein with NAD-binding domain and iron-sulfur cluster